MLPRAESRNKAGGRAYAFTAKHALAQMADEIAALDLVSIAAFWNSDVGQKILSKENWIQREHPFTSRLNRIDFSKLKLRNNTNLSPNEFIVLQGIIDIAVILPKEIWLLDFKTDQIKESELAERMEHYRIQVALYADAMTKIYNRPVTQRWLHFLALRQTVSIAD